MKQKMKMEDKNNQGKDVTVPKKHAVKVWR
jgi:hypothetical protein